MYDRDSLDLMNEYVDKASEVSNKARKARILMAEIAEDYTGPCCMEQIQRDWYRCSHLLEILHDYVFDADVLAEGMLNDLMKETDHMRKELGIPGAPGAPALT